MSIYMLFMDYEDNEDTHGEIPMLPHGWIPYGDKKVECQQNGVNGTHHWKFAKGFNHDHYYCIYCGTKRELTDNEK